MRIHYTNPPRPAANRQPTNRTTPHGCRISHLRCDSEMARGANPGPPGPRTPGALHQASEKLHAKGALFPSAGTGWEGPQDGSECLRARETEDTPTLHTPTHTYGYTHVRCLHTWAARARAISGSQDAGREVLSMETQSAWWPWWVRERGRTEL